MITIEAAYDRNTGQIMMVNYTASTKEVAALFPKSTKVRAGGWWNSARFNTDQRTGDKNEAAYRIVKSLIKNARKHGVEITMQTNLINSYQTLADLEAALAA